MQKTLFKSLVIELRPVQWIKNLFVFAGVIFSLRFTMLFPVVKSILAFLIFCMVCSSAYILNDIIDKDADKVHPEKKKRPIAAGVFSSRIGVFVALILACAAILFSFLLNYFFLLTVVCYLLIMVIYSLILKKLVILDVVVIAFGFVLRAIAGAVAIGVVISPWLLLTTFLVALFLALSKRRYEIGLLKADAITHRNTLSFYSLPLLDQMIAVVTASTVVTYALYTMAEQTCMKFGTRFLVFTVPFVIYGIFRYLYLVHRREEGGNPEKTLLTDKPLLLDVFLWIMSSVLIIYFSKQ